MDKTEPRFLSPSEYEGLLQDYGIRYLNRCEYLFSLKKKESTLSSYYLEHQQDFDALEKEYGDSIRDSYVAPCRIAYLGKKLNYGLFATELIEKNSLLAEYTGTVGIAGRHRKMKDRLGGFSTDYSWTFPVKRGWRYLELDGRLQGNETRFINHSFNPNVRMEHCLVDKQWVLFLVTEKKILPGDQICVNYGEEYWIGGRRELYLI